MNLLARRFMTAAGDHIHSVRPNAPMSGAEVRSTKARSKGWLCVI